MMTAQFVRGRKVVSAAVMLALVIGALALAPAAKAWLGFSLWYSNRTASAVTINWTIRGQEDSPTTGADVARVCWKPSTNPAYYPCDVNQTTRYQYGSVGSTMSHTISGLTCGSSYQVLVAQPYVLSQTWDWHEQTITVPACAVP
ncbi:MAG: hypothetical protein JOZ51_03835 [Chloroflexi bacterium]|nr:hypothetical protein [Chloroflexota bacterium]